MESLQTTVRRERNNEFVRGRLCVGLELDSRASCEAFPPTGRSWPFRAGSSDVLQAVTLALAMAKAGKSTAPEAAKLGTAVTRSPAAAVVRAALHPRVAAARAVRLARGGEAAPAATLRAEVRREAQQTAAGARREVPSVLVGARREVHPAAAGHRRLARAVARTAASPVLAWREQRARRARRGTR